MKSRIHFSATNFHENWAPRVLVSGLFALSGRHILSRRSTATASGRKSDRYVHLIVVGMSRMGGRDVTAAHIATTPTVI